MATPSSNWLTYGAIGGSVISAGYVWIVVSSLNTKIDELNKEIEKLNQANQVIHGKLTSEQSIGRRISQNRDELKQENQQLRKELDQLRREVGDIRKEIMGETLVPSSNEQSMSQIPTSANPGEIRNRRETKERQRVNLDEFDI